jgi:hypothetical protein
MGLVPDFALSFAMFKTGVLHPEPILFFIPNLID